MQKFTFRSFRQRLKHKRTSLKRLLSRVERKSPGNLQSIAVKSAADVWKQVDCLSCANCCKVMTPTYTNSDMKRIAAHLEMPIEDFQKKWLKKERGAEGDWVNKTTPCQFLNEKTNLCGIYEVRPADCAGFPHLSKKKIADYIHVHKQNIDECPATFRMVENMSILLEADNSK